MNESWLQILTILIANFTIIWWFRKESIEDLWEYRKESREDWKIIHQEMKEFKEAVRFEMKDFHERLIEIEKGRG